MIFDICNDLKNKSGVYKLVDKDGKIRYIGSCVDFRKRYINHISDIKRCPNKKIPQFEYENPNELSMQVVTLMPIDEMRNYEKLLITQLNPSLNTNFNKECQQPQHSEEVKNKISASMPKNRVVQKDLNGSMVRMFNSCRDVEKKLGFDNSAIAKACKGILKSAYGYKWVYLTSFG